MELIIKALYAKYEAQKAEALAELNILLTNTVGLADHTNIIQECDLKIKTITEAEELIKTLNILVQPQKSDESR